MKQLRILMPTAQTQTYHTILRQVGQGEKIGQSIFPVFYFIGQKRFSNARGHDDTLLVGHSMKALLDARQQFIGKDALHLERHAWHKCKSNSILFQPHTRCRAIGVRDIFTHFWQHRLTAVTLAHLETATLK